MKPVTFDGYIYLVIAVASACAASFGSDDAAKYIYPITLWWLKNFFIWIGAGALALKMYRSTTFADYKTAQNGSYHKETVVSTTATTDIPPGEKPVETTK